MAAGYALCALASDVRDAYCLCSTKLRTAPAVSSLFVPVAAAAATAAGTIGRRVMMRNMKRRAKRMYQHEEMI